MHEYTEGDYIGIRETKEKILLKPPHGRHLHRTPDVLQTL